MSTETNNDLEFDILNIFNEESKSNELKAGVHENVRLVTADPKKRKDLNGNVIKKQLFLKFKKFNKDNKDLGEIEVSFFVVDPARDTAVSNLHVFLAQTKELLKMYYTEEEIDEKYDPFRVLLDEDNSDDAIVEDEYKFDNVKKFALKTAKNYSKVEQASNDIFYSMVEDKIGFESDSFRLKLEESKDGEYIQIPRYDRFVEKSGIKKEDSVLYTTTK